MYNNKSYTKKPWQKTNKSEAKAYKPKRGALKPLLTDDAKQTANILTEDADYKEHIISKQVYRSGTLSRIA